MLNNDFKEMLQCLNASNVEYLLIGGYAMAAHGYPRATKDLDIWVMASQSNAKRLFDALTQFGAPMHQIAPEDFHDENTIFQIGTDPWRIDVTTFVEGVNFEACYAVREVVDFHGIEINLISREDLIKNKQSSGRPQDLADVETLRRKTK